MSHYVYYSRRMTPKALQALDRRLQRFLEDLTEPMGRSERRRWARVYLEGLLLDGERKSMEPMAERVAGADVQALRQFLGQSPWEVEEIERGLAYAVQVEPTTVVWTEDPNRPWPPPQQKGRPRKYPPLEALPQRQDLRALAEQLPRSVWRTLSWRPASRGFQRSRFALIPVWAAHGWRSSVRSPPDCGAWCASPRPAGEWSWITAS